MRSPARRTPDMLRFSTKLRAAASSVELETIFVLILILAIYLKLGVASATDGGTDVLWADAPKTLELCRGANPYVHDPWAAPYPPLYFLILAAILQAGFWVFKVPADIPNSISILRNAALVFDLATGFIVFLALKRARKRSVEVLSITALYFFAPVFTRSQEAWFHGDTFGIFMVALGVYLFMWNRYALGSVLIGLSAAFKIHTLIVLPLLWMWLYKNHIRWRLTLGLLAFVMFVGLIAPIPLIPGYYEGVLVHNSQTRPLYSVSLFNLFYYAPIFFGINVPVAIVNGVWLLAVLSLFIVVREKVRHSYGTLKATDIVILGVLIWMLPLRQVQPHYLLWWLIPLFMKGAMLESLVAAGLQELAYYVFGLGWTDFKGFEVMPSPISAQFILAASLLYAVAEAFALAFASGKIGITERLPIVKERFAHMARRTKVRYYRRVGKEP